MLRPFQVICICYRHSAESYGYQLRDDSRRHTALALLWHHFIVHNRGPLHTMQAAQATQPAGKCENRNMCAICCNCSVRNMQVLATPHAQQHTMTGHLLWDEVFMQTTSVRFPMSAVSLDNTGAPCHAYRCSSEEVTCHSDLASEVSWQGSTLL